MKKTGRAPKVKAAAKSRQRTVAIAAATLSELPAPPSAQKPAAATSSVGSSEPRPGLAKAGPLVLVGVLLGALVILASVAPLFTKGLAPSAAATVDAVRVGIGVVGAVGLIAIVMALAGRITAAGAAMASFADQADARAAQMQRSADEFAAAAARTDRIM